MEGNMLLIVDSLIGQISYFNFMKPKDKKFTNTVAQQLSQSIQLFRAATLSTQQNSMTSPDVNSENINLAGVQVGIF